MNLDPADIAFIRRRRYRRLTNPGQLGRAARLTGMGLLRLRADGTLEPTPEGVRATGAEPRDLVGISAADDAPVCVDCARRLWRDLPAVARDGEPRYDRTGRRLGRLLSARRPGPRCWSLKRCRARRRVEEPK